MLRASIDKELTRSKPSSDDVKEVYARFGLAYYHADVLHRGLCNLYSLWQLPPEGPMTRYRMEEHLRTAHELTLGQLLARMQTILSPPLLERLTLALERRNFIAHHFWYERIYLTGTLSGIEAMVDELSHDTDLFRELDREIDRISEPLQVRMGMTPEVFSKALHDIKSGSAEALEPLHRQRLPKKQETIVNVFDVPTSSGHTVLTFQTEDGLLWQLCDAGLGWSPYESVGASWPTAQNLAGLLPARINPRPKASAPWSFEIRFGAHAILAVYPGERSGQVVYNLRAQVKPTATEK